MTQRITIPEFYNGKKIFITGATGFLGKVLIWKLLQSCPFIDTIYVLIRAKRGKTNRQRLGEIFNFPIFDNFKKNNPEMLEKVILISGDLETKDFNLCESDVRKLQNEVDVVFHIAAILKMDATLKQAITMNVEATMNLLNICTCMKNLKVFIYVSTAYCYCDKSVTEEKVYPVRDSPYDIMNLVRWMDPKLLNMMTPHIIAPHPNTYTYSKRLAENVVSDFYPRLPVIIARPSIVIASFKEPFPGWIDNINGVVGIMIAAGKGVLRSLHTTPEYHADVVPVDFVCNGLIGIPWEGSEKVKNSPTVPVYNLCLTEVEPPTWDEMMKTALSVYFKAPFSLVLWYPNITMNRYKILHVISVVLFQWIPAYLIDFLVIFFGYKPFLVHVQKKIALGTSLLTYFSNRSWKFDTENILKLKNSMNPSDQATFPVTLRELTDRVGYMTTCSNFAREFLVKEDSSSIPRNITRLKMLYALHCFVKFVFCASLLWLFIKIFSLL